jgi:hypothetical protein
VAAAAGTLHVSQPHKAPRHTTMRFTLMSTRYARMASCELSAWLFEKPFLKSNAVREVVSCSCSVEAPAVAKLEPSDFLGISSLT